MKKFLLVFLSLAILVFPAAFSEDGWFTFTEDPNSLAGEWTDVCGTGASISIFYNESAAEENAYSVTVSLPVSETELYEWYMTGVYADIDDGCIISSDCSKNILHFSENDEMDFTMETVYENGNARFTLLEGMLYWQDNSENAGKNCVFERYNDIDFFSEGEGFADWETLLNPEQYSVLYIYDIFEWDGSFFVQGCFGEIDANGSPMYFTLDEAYSIELSSSALIQPASGSQITAQDAASLFTGVPDAGVYADFTMNEAGILEAISFRS